MKTKDHVDLVGKKLNCQHCWASQARSKSQAQAPAKSVGDELSNGQQVDALRNESEVNKKKTLKQKNVSKTLQKRAASVDIVVVVPTAAVVSVAGAISSVCAGAAG